MKQFFFSFAILVGLGLNGQVPLLDWKYESGTLSTIHAISALDDGGVVIVGTSDWPGEIFFTRFDENGQQIGGFFIQLNAVDNHGILKILPTQDGYIITGVAQNEQVTPMLTNFFAAKYSLTGDSIFYKKYPALSEDDYLFDATIAKNGDLCMIGYTEEIPNKGWEVHFLRANGQTGEILTEKYFGGTGLEVGFGIREMSDGGFLIAGVSESNDGDATGQIGLLDFWVFRTDVDLNIVWKKRFGGSEDESIFKTSKSKNGGLLISGSTYSTDGDLANFGLSGSQKGWAISIDSLGNLDRKFLLTSPETAPFSFSNGSFVFANRFESTFFGVDGFKKWSEKSEQGVDQVWQIDSENDLEFFVLTFTDPATLSNSKIEKFTFVPPNLTGQLHLDLNLDCQKQPNEIALENWQITLKNNETALEKTVSTDEMGRWAALVDTGSYTISAIWPDPSAYFAPCAAPTKTVSVGQNDSLNVDFGFRKLADCPFLVPEIAAPRLRRCFDNLVSLQICNHGTSTSTGGHFAEVRFSSDLDVSAVVAGDLIFQNDTLLRFDLPDSMGLFDCVLIQFLVKPNCDSVALGAFRCMTAEVFPQTFCIPPVQPGTWSGASIDATGDCASGQNARFFIKNKGAAASGVLNYIIIDEHVILKTGQVGPLTAGQISAPIEMPAAGRTMRLEVDQETNHPFWERQIALVEGCGAPVALGSANDGPLETRWPFSSQTCHEVIGAFDPNDKIGSPEGRTASRFVESGTRLDYTIRFQNTGNDTAFHVRVVDTLSVFLNEKSLEIGSASHAFRWKLDGRELIFDFDDIHLPDSAANKNGSQGFIHFRAEAVGPLGSEVKNAADIYFDFNPPIRTNETLHRIGKDFLMVSVLDFESEKGSTSIRVFPNPTENEAELFFEKIEKGKLKIVASTGREARFFDIKNGRTRLGGLAAGLYFFEIFEAEKRLGGGRFVLLEK